MTTDGGAVAGRFAELRIPGYADAVLIGRGGFAVVYRGRRVAFGQDVAIKVLDGSVVPGEVVARFDRERRILGALAQHPNIVTVYDGGIAGDGSPYLVMEYLRGGSLSARLARGGPLDVWQAVDVVVRLCGALETAHRTGVLHRDIKPDNILVSRYGEPVLADFGIARMAGALRTRSEVITATVAHAPPEVLDGRPPTPRADLYSLGSTLFALLTGTAPFRRPGDEGVAPLVARIIRDPVPDLRPRGVPDEVCAVLERVMAKDPAERPGSALELGRAFQQVQRGAGREASPLVVEEIEDGPDEAGPERSAGPPRAAPRPAATRALPGATGLTRPAAHPGPLDPEPAATTTVLAGPRPRLRWVLAGLAVALVGSSAVLLLPLLDREPPPVPAASSPSPTPPSTTLAPVRAVPGEPELLRYGFARSEVSTGRDIAWAVLLRNADPAGRVVTAVTARVRFLDSVGVRAEDRRTAYTVHPGEDAAVTGLVPDLERAASGTIRMEVELEPATWAAADRVPPGRLTGTEAALTLDDVGVVTVGCGVQSSYAAAQQASVEIVLLDSSGTIVGGQPSPAFEARPAGQWTPVSATLRAGATASAARCYPSIPQPQ